MVSNCPTRIHDLEAARLRFGALADRYVHFLGEADPLADAAADALASAGMGRARRWLSGALSDGIGAVSDAPPALSALLEQAETIPEWVDFERINFGCRVFRRCGAAAALTLSAYGLMRGYHSAAAVKPLAFTGQLSAKAPRRLAETGRYVLETIREDGLRRHGEGFKVAVRVRLMHAQVRRMILASGRWNTAAWGAPINQADSAITAMEFSSMVLRGSRTLGLSFTRAESEAVMHLWRYAAHLMGLHPELLEELENEARARRFEELVRFVSDGPDQDSLALAAALRDALLRNARTPSQRLQAHVLLPIHDGLAWVLCGEHVARDLKVPHRPMRHFIPVLGGAVRVLDTLRRHSPSVDAAWQRITSEGLETLLVSGLGGVEPSFEPAARKAGASVSPPAPAMA